MEKKYQNKDLGVPGSEQPVATSATSPRRDGSGLSAPIANAPPHIPSRREELAIIFAENWHGDQPYAGGPYFVHLREVRDVLIEFGYGSDEGDEDLLIAAWLHDVLEDTDCPVKHMAQHFGANVLNIVWAVSGFGNNRGERAGDSYNKLEVKRRAIPLKCADRIANMRRSKGTDLEQMYMKAWPGFRRMVAIHAPDPMRAELDRLHRVSDRSGVSEVSGPKDGTHAERGPQGDAQTQTLSH